MDKLNIELPKFKKFNNYIQDVNNYLSPILLSGLTDPAKVHFMYSTSLYTNRPICIITYDEEQAKRIIQDMSFFTKNIDYFPKREIVSFDYLSDDSSNLEKRINVLNNINKNKKNIIVITIEALMQKMISKEELYKNLISLTVGEEINLEAIKVKLLQLGYKREEIVENQGQYSVRGGIIDIGIENTKGRRIELFRR